MTEPATRPVSYLRAHAERMGDKLAVIADRPDGTLTRWTFAELNREASKLAHVLLDFGVQPGDKLVWCGPNSPGVVRASHARQKVGATSVPLNYRLAPDEAAYVVGNSDAVVVYVDAEYAELFAKIRDRIPKVREILVFGGAAPAGMLDGDALVAAASDAEPPELDQEYPAAMFYTSGTTGRPKGALRPPTNPASVMSLLQLIGHAPDDVYITTGPLYHSGPGGYFRIAHLLANTVVLQRRFDAEDWLRLVEKYRVTMTFSAPAPIRLVCALPAEVKARYDMRSMKRMIANAAPWSFALKEAYMADFGEDSLWEVYGSTEMGVNTVLAPADQRRKPGSCGRPAPGMEIQLYDDAGAEVTEPHVPGEVFIRSTSAFLTYYKADDKVRAASRGEFTSVGDVAYRDDEGYYYICDRKNDMIITGGMNVYPAEIEAALERHPEVADVAVFGIPSEEWGESVHVVIVPRPGATLTAEAVSAFARQHLAGYKMPRSVAFADELPRTGSGKLLKRVLREPFWQGHARRVG
jgi:fatty-acyl-CoA synthase/long-chain acyl-CoA synthetase